MLNNRNYLMGLITGGLMGAVLGLVVVNKQKPSRKLLQKSDRMKHSAQKVVRGVSRGVVEMLHR